MLIKGFQRPLMNKNYPLVFCKRISCAIQCNSFKVNGVLEEEGDYEGFGRLSIFSTEINIFNCSFLFN